jgi:hypothetical protein
MSDELDNVLKGVLGDSAEVSVSYQGTENNPENIQTPDDSKTIEKLNEKITELELELAKKNMCQRCGRELGTAPLKVSEEVTEEYFRHLLGQKPFEKTFKLFDGRLLLTFRELSGDSIIENNKTLEKANTDDEFADILEMYLITSMLVRVEIYDAKTMVTETLYSMSDEQLVDNTKNPRAAYDSLLRAVGQMKIAVIRRACTTFQYLITALIDKGQDPNFYMDAGLL